MRCRNVRQKGGDEMSEEMKKEALAHALLGSYLYKNRLYKGSEEK